MSNLHPTTTSRISAQSRLTSKVVQHAPPQVSAGADHVLADIVARLKAGAKQSSVVGDRQQVHGHIQQVGQTQAVYDPFSRYQKNEGHHGGKMMASSKKADVSTSAHNCICNRPRQLVMCQHCGEMFEGRVKMICPSHPSVTYLLDVVACRGCKMDNLKDLKEFPISNC